MTFCTIVEFEWDETFDHAGFAEAISAAGGGTLPDGCLSRISSIDAAGARMVEVWRSGADAQAFARSSAPGLAGIEMPAPTLVQGFEVTSYSVA